MPAATRRTKKAPNEYTEELSDIVMDDSEGVPEEASEEDFSSQSQPSRVISAAKKAPKRVAKVTEGKKRVTATKKLATDTKASVKNETKYDILKTSTSRYAGSMRRLGLSKNAIPKGPPSPVRITK